MLGIHDSIAMDDRLMKLLRRVLLTCTLIAAGCGGTETAESAEPLPLLAEASSDLPSVLVYKTATCGCCNGWIEHLRAAGFTVDARDTRDLMSLKVSWSYKAENARPAIPRSSTAMWSRGTFRPSN